MSFYCPECQFESVTTGLCPCSDFKDHVVHLIEKVDPEMANVIKYTGNTERFAGQKKGTLLSSELQIVKEMSTQLKEHVGIDSIPRGSAIRCVFIGENGIPFVELRNYGSAALHRLKGNIGQEYVIDIPATTVIEPIKLELS